MNMLYLTTLCSIRLPLRFDPEEPGIGVEYNDKF